jgi:hypothetical protein
MDGAVEMEHCVTVYDHDLEKHLRNGDWDTPYQADRSIYLLCRIPSMKRAVSSMTGSKPISELSLIVLPHKASKSGFRRDRDNVPATVVFLTPLLKRSPRCLK